MESLVRCMDPSEQTDFLRRREPEHPRWRRPVSSTPRGAVRADPSECAVGDPRCDLL